MTDSLDIICHLEKSMQQPMIRRDRDKLELLIHHDFLEVGASGRMYNKVAVMELMAEPIDIEVEDMQARWIGPTTAQVLWTSVIDGRRAYRSSIWVESAVGWQLIFHQGTPLSDEIT